MPVGFQATATLAIAMETSATLSRVALRRTELPWMFATQARVAFRVICVPVNALETGQPFFGLLSATF